MRRLAISTLLAALLTVPAVAQQPKLVCWEFASQPIPCDGNEHGAEFGVGLSSPIPSWVPVPLVIEEVHMTYYEWPGGPAAPLSVDSYGAVAANTDPGRAWLNSGCSPQNQTCPISTGVDLGRLFIRYRNPKPTAVFTPRYPVVVGATDGLVLSQVCYGGGNIQAIWDFCWKQ